jgi:branched-chain amino acid transport system ATP-binding protein
MLLDIDDLSVSYGAVGAVTNLSLTVARGSVVAILGSNGAGKSTLLGAVMGALEAHCHGTVRFDGRNILGSPAEALVAQGIALVPEGRQLFAELTVHENLRMGAYLRRDDQGIADDMARVLEMFPRLAERRDQLAGTLSGGEQQMVAIGRALMSRPKLLLLDEPSLGLAPLVVREIMQLIARINQAGVTVVLVEQNALQALRIADHAYVLEKGRVVLSGRADQLAKDTSVTAAYLGSS